MFQKTECPLWQALKFLEDPTSSRGKNLLSKFLHITHDYSDKISAGLQAPANIYYTSIVNPKWYLSISIV
jgi:hypothetical protein